jgi:GAF domain-containing protein
MQFLVQISTFVKGSHMFEAPALRLPTDKPALYQYLNESAAALMAGEHDRIANAANVAALIFHTLPDLNWAGFYFFDGKELVVGPFQGRPACVRIALDRGVCGAAARLRQIQIVSDVHQFPGHIACDSASNAELVLPIVSGDLLIGVLDLDSPSHGRFDQADADGLSTLVQLYVDTL